jgi:hypothetical protein
MSIQDVGDTYNFIRAVLQDKLGQLPEQIASVTSAAKDVPVCYELMEAVVRRWLEDIVVRNTRAAQAAKKKVPRYFTVCSPDSRKTGIPSLQIAECASGNLPMARADTQKILDALISLDTPESSKRGIVEKPYMAGSKSKGPGIRGQPSISPERAIELLWS